MTTAITETPSAPGPPPRRLTLADAMLLVAVMAAGLILLRVAAGLGLFRSDPTARLPPGREFMEFLSVGSGCVLLPLALLVIALRFRHRGPARRELIQRPGFVACLAVSIAAIVPLARFVIRVAAADELNRSGQVGLNFNNSFGSLKTDGGLMIAGAWLALILTGRFRPGPDWIDRLGCGIGGGFVMIHFCTELYYLWVSSL